jgi:hypothetical protein
VPQGALTSHAERPQEVDTFAAGLFVGAFRAFVLMLMWNWFVSPVFHTANISFWQVLGLLWLVQVFVGEGEEDLDENRRWERLFAILITAFQTTKKNG